MKYTPETLAAFLILGKKYNKSEEFCVKQLQMIKQIKQIKSVDIGGDGSTIIIKTNPIIIEKNSGKFKGELYKLGKFEIHFDYRGFSVRIRNETPKFDKRYGIWCHHPHMHSLYGEGEGDWTRVCWGFIGNHPNCLLIDNYLKSFNIGLLMTFIVSFLETYMPNHGLWLSLFQKEAEKEE